ncbi:long-chain acyl-CoA synthetase [Jatrophihabitans sp. GAS493]|uniref:class I adenylate-forming enzyme family protein n=1 Tax=Jatrophihabitans sp. GAS493 TaxID=1907575 RepID=UPI000BC09C59|nr:AMP-binding protein [Jatrophihabitans sp. GAS493]SOD70659.1 long-chain acyl-CoA synthetase [Jatrophihabitans sp. GAS493]
MPPTRSQDTAFTGLSDLVRLIGGIDPQRVAVSDGRSQATWGELDAATSRCAQAMLAAGLSAGDRVVLQLGARVEFLQLYFGALRAGLVVVPVNPGYTSVEMNYVLADSGARLLVTESPEAASAATSAVELVILTGRATEAGNGAAGGVRTLEAFLAAAERDDDPRSDRSGESIAIVLYTSGTSGYPKGAMLSVRALLGNLAQIAEVEPQLITASDVVLVPLPLFHIYGLNAALCAALHVGATVVLAERFDAAATLATMRAERISAVVGAPGMFVQWAAHPNFAEGFESVRFALSGAAPLSPTLVQLYADIGIALYEGYGLTETAPVLALNAIDAGGAPRAGSVGKPLPGVELQLRNSDGSVIDAEDEDPGQLFVRGANLFSGYWPDGRGGPDEEGWFATGDIAIIESSGALLLVGRTSDLIIVNGFNVYSAEVERVLGQVAGVAEVAVVGIPDEQTGEAVAAFVVPARGETLEVEELVAKSAKSLARYKLPTRVRIVDTLPHTVTGKVQKWRLLKDATH